MSSALKTLSLSVLLTLLLTGCRLGANRVLVQRAGTPAPVVTFTRAAQAATPTAAFTPSPSATLPPPLPSPSATPLPTLTLTPTPHPLLAQARLLGVSWQQPGYNLLLSIQFPGPVQAEDFRVVVEEEETYSCQTLPQYPDRLYCLGRGRNVYDRIDVQIFPAGSTTPGFEGSLYVPYFTEKFTEK